MSLPSASEPLGKGRVDMFVEDLLGRLKQAFVRTSGRNVSLLWKGMNDLEDEYDAQMELQKRLREMGYECSLSVPVGDEEHDARLIVWIP